MSQKTELWEILVPTLMNGHFVRTRHHKHWDHVVRKITGGLTITATSKGQWIDPATMILHEERVIPVRIACTRKQIEEIINFTIKHYNQIAVLAYKLSDEVILKYANK